MNDDDDIQDYVNPNKQRNDVLEEVAKEIDAQCKLDPKVPILHNDAATNPIKSEDTKK